MDGLTIFSIVVDIFTCFGIIIAVLEFHLLKKSTLSDNERNQKQATIDFYMIVKDDLYTLNHSIYSKYKREKILYSEIEEDQEFSLILKNYLNIMEIVSTGINTGIYNIDVFDRLYGDVCVRLADQLEDYITKRREIVKEQEIYRDFDLLVLRLKEIHNKDIELLNSKAPIKNKFKF